MYICLYRYISFAAGLPARCERKVTMGYLELVKQARDQGKAIGAFNIFNMLSASGVVDAASERGEGVILQTSVKTVTYYGAERLYRMLRAATEAAPVPVLLNLDHCKDISIAKACVDAGWDCVMYDGSALPLAENIANMKQQAAMEE